MWFIIYAVFIFIYADQPFKYTAINEIIIFLLLGIQLLSVNFILLRRINRLFGAEADTKFKEEKRFLMTTLIFFSISYLLTMAKNVLIFDIVAYDDDEVATFLCKTNFRQSMVNIVTYFLTEWLPYAIIFILNYKNFSTIE